MCGFFSVFLVFSGRGAVRAPAGDAPPRARRPCVTNMQAEVALAVVSGGAGARRVRVTAASAPLRIGRAVNSGGGGGGGGGPRADNLLFDNKVARLWP